MTKYINLGWHIIPVAGPNDTGSSPGKRPLIGDWVNAASNEHNQIEKWRNQFPGCNWGVVTGKRSGIVVMDIDGRNGGGESLDELKNYGLPDTVTCITGSGWLHYYFKYPAARDVPSRTGKEGLLPGIEIKSDGGQVILPPSVHQSGGVYQWELSSDPEDIELAEMPGWLLEMIDATASADKREPLRIDYEIIPDGARNDTLFKLGCSFRDKGLNEQEIAAALQGVNASRCRPELSLKEINVIAGSAARYEPKHVVIGQASTKATVTHKLFPYTDLGNAERLIYYYGDNIRYCPELKLFIAWDGKRWRKDTSGEVERMSFQTVRSIKKDVTRVSSVKEIEACLSWSKSSESRSKLQNMVELAKVQPGISITINDIDQGKYFVNCLNGTIDLKTGNLLPHCKEHMITHLLPFEYKPYNPKKDCPRWIQFLCEITNNDLGLMRYLWKLSGLCLSGDTSEHILNIFYGSKGRNGKSVFIGILQEVLGELQCVLPFASFEPKNGGGIPNDIASIAGKRLVIASESNEGRRLDEAVVKSLTGGDILSGRFLRCEFFQFKPTHKIIMSTNNKPIIRETGNAIWARLRLIPFEVSFEGREDKHLIEKLQKEIPEIFAWMVEGFAQWQREGLEQPDTMKQAGAEYRREEDVVQTYITECCFLGPGVSVAAKELHDRFIEWAAKNGEKPISQRIFNKRIKEREFKGYSSGGFLKFQGIGLLDIKRVAVW